jgi:hypothetical protein
MDWWSPLFGYLFRRTAIDGMEWDTTFRVLTDFVFVTPVALNGAQFGYIATAPLPVGWYRDIMPHSQRLSTSASNIKRAQHEVIILDRIQARLRNDNTLTDDRRDALAERYFKIARRVFPDDKKLFQQLVQQVVTLNPAFKAEGRRYQQLIRWFGYAAAEHLRRLSLRIRARRNPTRVPQPVTTELIHIKSDGPTIIPKH